MVGSYRDNSDEKWYDLGQSGSNEGGYILRLEPAGLDDKLDVGSERGGSKKSLRVPAQASRTVQSNTIASGHMWLFKLKWIKIKEDFSSLVALSTSHMLNTHIWLVVLSSTEV